MDIYNLTRKLAKHNKYQNILAMSKEINGINLFRNKEDFSYLQSIFLNYLFMYDTINRDISIKKISKHVNDNEIYEDAYILWKNEKGQDQEFKENKKSDIKLVISDKIKSLVLNLFSETRRRDQSLFLVRRGRIDGNFVFNVLLCIISFIINQRL